MKKYLYRCVCGLMGLFYSVQAMQAEERMVTITTNVGVMKAKLYENVPNHVKTFIARAQNGEYDGTLFTRVIKDFMIQGGAPDSRGAAPGARVGFGDRSAEILPEMRPEYFHKKGALAAPRQNDDVNPQRKSDMSQFFIVEGRVYRSGELDTLEKVQNYKIRQKALKLYYHPQRVELDSLKKADPKEYNKRIAVVRNKVDSLILATPGHLIFTDEQRKAYPTVGGSHHLDGHYTIFGELTEGFEVLDKIASQKTDQYDRPLNDIKIIKVTIA